MLVFFVFIFYFLFFGINGYILVIFISELLNSSISIIQLKQITRFKLDIVNWILKPFISIFISYFLTEKLVPNACTDLFSFILKLFIYSGFYFLCILLLKCDQ